MPSLRLAPLVIVPVVGLVAIGILNSRNHRIAVTGTVSFAGGLPESRPIDMSADEYCLSVQSNTPTTTPVVVSDEGRLADALVYIKEGLSGDHPVAEAEVLLSQSACRYTPRVVALQVGQELRILNDDDTFHNVHAFAEVNRGFNIGQPIKGMQSRRTFREPEIGIDVKCDVHGWMQGYIHVLGNPFYGVTRVDGTFDLGALPPGEYVIEAWHPTLGTATESVRLAAGQPASIHFTFE